MNRKQRKPPKTLISAVPDRGDHIASCVSACTETMKR